MNYLSRFLLLITLSGTLPLVSYGQHTTFERHQLESDYRNNGGTLITHHFLNEDEDHEFTVVAQSNFISLIYPDGTVDFKIQFKNEDNKYFTPLDIASIDDKIILLGYYTIDPDDIDLYGKDRQTSIISMNQDESINWERIYASEYDKIIESVNGNILMAGIDTSGLYRLTEVENSDGSFISFNAYELYNEDYDFVPKDLQVIKRNEQGYFAIGHTHIGAEFSTSIYTNGTTLITTSKYLTTDNSRLGIYDIELDGENNFYFIGYCWSGKGFTIGSIDTLHNVLWLREYVLTSDIFDNTSVYITKNKHILERSDNINLEIGVRREVVTATYYVVKKSESVAKLSVGLIQFDNHGALITSKYYTDEQDFIESTIHRLNDHQLVLITDETPIVSKPDGGLNYYILPVDLSTCNDNSITFRESEIVRYCSDVNVETVDVEDDSYLQDYNVSQVEVSMRLICHGEIIIEERRPATVQLKEIGLESYITIFPNPATENVTIELGNLDATIEIFDVNGKKVISEFSIDNNQMTIKGLKSGVYLLKIKSEEKTITKKLIMK